MYEPVAQAGDFDPFDLLVLFPELSGEVLDSLANDREIPDDSILRLGIGHELGEIGVPDVALDSIG